MKTCAQRPVQLNDMADDGDGEGQRSAELEKHDQNVGRTLQGSAIELFELWSWRKHQVRARKDTHVSDSPLVLFRTERSQVVHMNAGEARTHSHSEAGGIVDAIRSFGRLKSTEPGADREGCWPRPSQVSVIVLLSFRWSLSRPTRLPCVGHRLCISGEEQRTDCALLC